MADSELDLEDEIAAAAVKPKVSKADFGSYERHSLPDMIEADKYIRGRDAQNDGRLGIKMTKLVPPGAS